MLLLHIIEMYNKMLYKRQILTLQEIVIR